MKIRMSKGRAATVEAIRDFEQRYGAPLPDSLRAFVAQHDGAEPENNVFSIGGENQSGVNRFVRLDQIAKEMRHIENLAPRSFPIAWAEGGNYVLVDLDRNGEVLFWDHEEPEKRRLVASEFGEFLNLLEPFDVNSIEFKPGQVESAWIDPDFLKGLGK